MNVIQLIADLIIVLLEELEKGLKKHKVLAIIFPILGAFVAVLTFIFYDFFKDKVAEILFGIAGAFIGSVFAFFIREIVRDSKKIKSLKAFQRYSNDLLTKPTKDGNTEAKLYELFKETYISVIA